MAEEIKTSGITSNTPKNIVLGAGTIHKGLEFKNGKWNFSESLIGATQGGNSVSIAPEILDVEADGAYVKVEGLAVKIGETATMNLNLLEVTPEILEMVTFGEKAENSANFEGYSELRSKSRIEKGDYIKNLGFIGKTIEGEEIIIIFDSALCTSGLSFEGKNKENTVIPVTFECYASITEDGANVDKLPWHILTPNKITE